MKRLHDLDAYVTGELVGDSADAFEEALFGAPDDPDVAIVDRIARHGAILAEHGTFDIGVLRSQIDTLLAEGRIIQICDAGPPGPGAFTIRKDAEFVAVRLPLGRTDHARVDVDITIVKYDVTKTIADILVDPSEGTVYGLCARALAHQGFGHETIVRVHGRDGGRPLLAEWHLVGNVAV
jgi:hypothetical protein